MNDHNSNSIKEVNDLLGEDSDVEEMLVKDYNLIDHDIIKANTSQTKNELNDLLGEESDNDNDYNNDIIENNVEIKRNEKEEAEEDKYIIKDNDDIQQNSEINNRSNELDQILGKTEVSFKTIVKDIKSKTSSKIILPNTYKPNINQNSIFVRTPNFIKIQLIEFNEFDYNPEEEKSILDGSIAIVRWRFKRNDVTNEIEYDLNGNPIKESNARIIQWNDGTMQLVVGDAVFQCKAIPVDNCYVYEQQKVKIESLNSMVIDATIDTCLDCIATIKERFVLQPSSLDSEIHSRMSLKISEKFRKERKTRDRDYEEITEKPEMTLAALARKEEEEIRKMMKSKQSQDTFHRVNTYQTTSYTSNNNNTNNIRTRPTMSADYLVDNMMDDNEHQNEYDEDISLLKYKSKPITTSKKTKISNKKVITKKETYYELEDDDEDDDEDEDEEEFDDDDDDDGDENEDDNFNTIDKPSKHKDSKFNNKTQDNNKNVSNKITTTTTTTNNNNNNNTTTNTTTNNNTTNNDDNEEGEFVPQRKRMKYNVIDSDED